MEHSCPQDSSCTGTEGMQIQKWSMLLWPAQAAEKIEPRLRRIMVKAEVAAIKPTNTRMPIMMQQQNLTPRSTCCSAVKVRVKAAGPLATPIISISLSPLGCLSNMMYLLSMAWHCSANDKLAGSMSELSMEYSPLGPSSYHMQRTAHLSSPPSASSSYEKLGLQTRIEKERNSSTSRGTMQRRRKSRGVSSRIWGYQPMGSAGVRQEPMKPDSQTQKLLRGLQWAFWGQLSRKLQVWLMARTEARRRTKVRTGQVQAMLLLFDRYFYIAAKQHQPEQVQSINKEQLRSIALLLLAGWLFDLSNCCFPFLLLLLPWTFWDRWAGYNKRQRDDGRPQAGRNILYPPKHLHRQAHSPGKVQNQSCRLPKRPPLAFQKSLQQVHLPAPPRPAPARSLPPLPPRKVQQPAGVQRDLAELMEEGTQSKTTLNGVIYGTRSFNFDKIIGKYSYIVYKSPSLKSATSQPSSLSRSPSPLKKSKLRSAQQEQQSREEGGHSKVQAKSRFQFGERRKDKPPEFAFKQAILQHSQDINSKIKELTKSMNKILGAKPEQGLEKDDRYRKFKIDPIFEDEFEEGDSFYRYSSKVEEGLKDGQSQQFKTLVIRNIRIDRAPFDQEPDRTARMSIGSKVTSKEKKEGTHILLVFYELLEDKKLRKRVLQVCMHIHYGCDNRFMANSVLYLPNSPRKVLLEVAFLSSFEKDSNLNGVLEPSRAKSRLVELLDTQNRERGILICQLEECKLLDQEQLNGYWKQTSKFDSAMRKFGSQFSNFVKKAPVVAEPQQEKVESKPLDDLGNDTLYSQFHSKSKIEGREPKRIRLRSEGPKTSDIQLLTPSISRYRSNKSVVSRRGSGSRSVTSSFDFDSKSVRGRPLQSQTMVKLQGKGGADWEGDIRVYLQNVVVNVYGVELRDKKVLVSVEVAGQSNSKKLLLKGDNDRQALHMEFKDRRKDDTLTVSVLLNRPNTTRFYKIGQGHKLLSELGRGSRVKIFLSARAKVNGFVQLTYKLFRQKQADEKSQSFYYQQGFDRDISLVSQSQNNIGDLSRDRSMMNTYDNFEEVDVPMRDTSMVRGMRAGAREEDEFELSVGSRLMLEERTQMQEERTQLQDISERMSEKEPSEVLEEEDYVGGTAVKRRL